MNLSLHVGSFRLSDRYRCDDKMFGSFRVFSYLLLQLFYISMVSVSKIWVLLAPSLTGPAESISTALACCWMDSCCNLLRQEERRHLALTGTLFPSFIRFHSRSSFALPLSLAFHLDHYTPKHYNPNIMPSSSTTHLYRSLLRELRLSVSTSPLEERSINQSINRNLYRPSVRP